MPRKRTPSEPDNPLTVLVRILADALLDDPIGVNETAKNALLILVDIVNKGEAAEIEKKLQCDFGRYKYDQ